MRRHHLYRIYANEWWHFEYQPHARSAPPRLPHPGATGTVTSQALSGAGG